MSAGIGAAALAAAGGVWALLRNGERGQLSQSERDLITRVSDITIPASETLGAVGAEAPAWVELAIAKGVGGVEASLARSLAHELAAAGGRAFLSLPPDAQIATLTQFDEQAFAQNASVGESWRAVKALIATAYYTSEIGASQELQYELVPGRFDADLPVDEHARAWSSDWTAWDFG